MKTSDRTYGPVASSWPKRDVRRTVIPPEPNGESADITRGSADSTFGALVSKGPKNPWRALTRSPGRFTRTLTRS